MRKLWVMIFLFVSLVGVRVEAADLMRNFYLGESISQIAAERDIRYTHYWQQANCDVYISYLSNSEDKELLMGGFAKAEVTCYRFYAQGDRLVGLSAHLKDRSVWNSFKFSDFKDAISREYGEPIVDEDQTIVVWEAGEKFMYIMKTPIGNMICISMVAPEVLEAMLSEM